MQCSLEARPFWFWRWNTQACQKRELLSFFQNWLIWSLVEILHTSLLESSWLQETSRNIKPSFLWPHFTWPKGLRKTWAAPFLFKKLLLQSKRPPDQDCKLAACNCKNQYYHVDECQRSRSCSQSASNKRDFQGYVGEDLTHYSHPTNKTTVHVLTLQQQSMIIQPFPCHIQNK